MVFKDQQKEACIENKAIVMRSVLNLYHLISFRNRKEWDFTAKFDLQIELLMLDSIIYSLIEDQIFNIFFALYYSFIRMKTNYLSNITIRQLFDLYNEICSFIIIFRFLDSFCLKHK